MLYSLYWDHEHSQVCRACQKDHSKSLEEYKGNRLKQLLRNNRPVEKWDSWIEGSTKNTLELNEYWIIYWESICFIDIEDAAINEKHNNACKYDSDNEYRGTEWYRSTNI